MIITLVDGVLCTPDRARVTTFSADQFLDLVSDADKVPSQEAAAEADKLKGAGFILAQYKAGAVSKDAANLDPASTTDVLCFDVDAMTLAEVQAVAPRWARVNCAVYSTWKHTEAAPRLRLLVALDVPISNVDRKVFRHCYLAAALALGLTFDPRAAAAANLYFFPQHKPAGALEGERQRFRGPPLPVAGLLAVDVGTDDGDGDAAGVTGATLDRPTAKDLKGIATKLKRRRGTHSRQAALALAAVVRGERYAAAGAVFNVTQHLAFALALELPELDAPWFRETWLEKSWGLMWPGEDLGQAARDWGNAWDSAVRKVRDAARERARERQAVAPASGEALEQEQVDALAPYAGALIAVHGSGFYVLDARAGEYSRAVKGGAVAPRARDLLGGVPGVFVTEPRENGRPVAKNPTQLVMEYGTVIDHVHYWAKAPARGWEPETRAIHLRAYTWNEWDPVYHPIVDELWRAMAGDKYAGFEAMMFKWRDLSQPLPALTLVGPPGTWKSKTAQTLSRCWGDRHASTACRAEQVLRRFSAPLLTNPVVWTDEQMAVGEGGQDIPEAYRESISETAHQIECKGLDPITLHTATRHVIAVNDVTKVFSTEVHGDAVRATLDRFMVVDIAGPLMAAFEERWKGTAELAALREGAPMLEHQRWIEANTDHPANGRFWVAGNTDPEILTRARFTDDVLNLVLMVATDAVLAEAAFSQPGSDPDRTPLTGADVDGGVLRFSPKRLVAVWALAPATQGWRGGAPTPARIGKVLAEAGFRAHKAEAVKDTKHKAWTLNAATYREWLKVSDLYDPREVEAAMVKVWAHKVELA